jgi:single-strand DNA-binding protein
MAEGLNRVMLLGNLGADPELRFTQGGQAVLNIRLATTESYLDKDRVRKERTDWHNVTAVGQAGRGPREVPHEGLADPRRGTRSRTSSYDDRDGNKRYKTEVVANNVVLVGGRSRGGGAEESFGGPPADFGGGGPPRRAPGPAPAQRPAQAAPAHDPADDFAGGGDFGGGDDDIPF